MSGFIFRAETGGNTQLWVSDGSETGTRVLHEALPQDFVVLNGVAVYMTGYFSDNFEIWATDGRSDGTVRLAPVQVRPQPDGRTFVQVGEQLFFVGAAAGDDGSSVTQLWVTDGTESGTRPLVESGVYESPTRLGDRLVFVNQDAEHGQELWVTDGTVEGTGLIKDLTGGVDAAGRNLGTDFGGFTPLGNDRLVFWAKGEGGTDQEPWATDGTAAGTFRLGDLVPGAEGSGPRSFTALGDQVAFLARSETGVKLWITDGTREGTRAVADASFGNGAPFPVLGDQLLYRHGGALWATDGGEPVRLFPSDVDGDPTIAGEAAYFRSYSHGFWVTDGTPGGARQLSEQNPGSFYVVGDRLLYSFGVGADQGVWIADGTGEPVRLNDARVVEQPTLLPDGRIVMVIADASGDREPWVTDATPEGTFRLADIMPGGEGSRPVRFALVGDQVYFAANGPAGQELWVTDGTVGGTHRVTDADVLTSPGEITGLPWLGSGEDDDFVGSAGKDIFYGGGGDDVIAGAGGSDRLRGDEGRDHLVGGDGDDWLRGDEGDDLLDGGAGADRLDGGAGADTADYSGSRAGVTVRLWNGTGQGGDAEGDTLTSIEDVTGSAHVDALVGANGVANRLDGAAGDDRLFGLSGDDLLIGGAGDDHLTGGAGSDTLDGGAGTDTADYSASQSAVTVRLWNGTGVGGEAQGDTLVGVENVSGSAFNDSLVGANLTANRLDGGAGSDTLYGLSGDDVLVGGAGADRLDGGAGTDTADYSASGAGVTVRLWNGAGAGGDAEGDTLTGVEDVVGSRFNDSLVGENGVANRLAGGAGSDNLFGLSGDDVLVGGAGADRLDGGAGVDTADYSGSAGRVTVRLWNGTGAGGDAEGDTLAGVENVVGSAFGDALIGADGVSNRLEGAAGDDNLFGLSGDDVLTGGAGMDRLVGGSGADQLEGGSGVDTADYSGSAARVTVRLWNGTGAGGDAQGDTLSGVEDLVGSAFNDSLVGANGVANRLDGGAGDDQLYGLSGDDVLVGGAGNDGLHGGAGADRFILGGAFGSDRVSDFSLAEGDVIQFDVARFADFAAVMAHATDTTEGVIISRQGVSVTLSGVTKAELEASAFVFGNAGAGGPGAISAASAPPAAEADPTVLEAKPEPGWSDVRLAGHDGAEGAPAATPRLSPDFGFDPRDLAWSVRTGVADWDWIA